MYIQTEDTPNPNAMKFFPGCDINQGQLLFFNSRDEAILKSDLAAKIFTIGEISAIFLGKDFITVTKKADAKWDLLKPEILMSIMDYLVSGLPVLKDINNNSANEVNLSEIEKQIVEIIEIRVRPSVAMDGGDIIFKEFKDGIVYLELRGACSGCPSSTITLKNGIESMLKHFVPEVIAVESVESLE
jgi:Fe-S cluster biogenesis protein NfuA